MSQVDAPRGRTCSRTLRSVALLTSGVLALPVLAGCSADESERTGKALAPDIAAATRGKVADGGTLRWAVDAMPATLNAFQADADAATAQIAGAVLPACSPLDENGRPQRNPDYLESAKIVDREPKQVVLYKLNQKAVWSDGREIGAADFVAQWRALSAARTAPSGPRATPATSGSRRSSGRRRSGGQGHLRQAVHRLAGALPPAVPEGGDRHPGRLQRRGPQHAEGHRRPVQLDSLDRQGRQGHTRPQPALVGAAGQARQLVLAAVPRDKRAAALAAGTLDVAEIDPPGHAASTARPRRAGDAADHHGRGAAGGPARAALLGGGARLRRGGGRRGDRPGRRRGQAAAYAAGRRRCAATWSASRWSPPTPSSR